MDAFRTASASRSFLCHACGGDLHCERLLSRASGVVLDGALENSLAGISMRTGIRDTGEVCVGDGEGV